MKNEKNELPFFTRYLEGQEFPGVRTGVKAGAITNKLRDQVDETHKYPSDNDEDIDR